MAGRAKLLIGLAVVLCAGAALAGWSVGQRSDGPPLSGAMRDFRPVDPPIPAPDVALDDPGIGRSDLDRFRGRYVLVNLWATWCGPCVKELPSLLRLKQARESGNFRLVSISQDRTGANTVTAFLAQHAVDGLDHFIDPDNKASQAFGIEGLPTTFLIDPAGRIVGKFEGDTDWGGPDARALIDWYLRAGARNHGARIENIRAPGTDARPDARSGAQSRS